MHHTHYHRPASVAEAVKLIGEHPDDKVLAGGQSTLPSIKLGLLAPDGFIDLSGIGELRGIRAEGTSVRIGAMTTHHTVATSKEVQAMIPALAALAGGIGDRSAALWRTAIRQGATRPAYSAWAQRSTPIRGRSPPTTTSRGSTRRRSNLAN